jgi:hypothetical protein
MDTGSANVTFCATAKLFQTASHHVDLFHSADEGVGQLRDGWLHQILKGVFGWKKVPLRRDEITARKHEPRFPEKVRTAKDLASRGAKTDKPVRTASLRIAQY